MSFLNAVASPACCSTYPCEPLRPFRFDQSDEETWPDQNISTYQPTAYHPLRTPFLRTGSRGVNWVQTCPPQSINPGYGIFRAFGRLFCPNVDHLYLYNVKINKFGEIERQFWQKFSWADCGPWDYVRPPSRNHDKQIWKQLQVQIASIEKKLLWSNFHNYSDCVHLFYWILFKSQFLYWYKLPKTSIDFTAELGAVICLFWHDLCERPWTVVKAFPIPSPSHCSKVHCFGKIHGNFIQTRKYMAFIGVFPGARRAGTDG